MTIETKESRKAPEALPLVRAVRNDDREVDDRHEDDEVDDGRDQRAEVEELAVDPDAQPVGATAAC